MVLTFVVFSADSFAQALSATEQRQLFQQVQKLQKRVVALEKSLSKVEDNSMFISDLPANTPKQLTKKKSKKEILKYIWEKLKFIKKNRQEQKEYLKELMKED